MPKERLPSKGLNKDRKCVIALAHVGGVDLAGITREDHLGALADAGEDRLERRRLKVLGFIDDDELTLQRSPAQERDRLEGELSAIRQIFNQAARVAT